MPDISRLIRIQIGVLLLFVFMKGVVRPFVLAQDLPVFFDIFVLSFPNFCEAVAGVLSLTYIGLVVNQRWVRPARRLNESWIYPGATIAGGIYVILQEFKIHNLGGANVYDPYDVLFSVIGLITVYGLLLYLKPTASKTSVS